MNCGHCPDFSQLGWRVKVTSTRVKGSRSNQKKASHANSIGVLGAFGPLILISVLMTCLKNKDVDDPMNTQRGLFKGGNPHFVS